MKSSLFWAFTICILLQFINSGNTQIISIPPATTNPPTTSKPPTTTNPPVTSDRPPVTSNQPPVTTTTFTPIITTTTTTTTTTAAPTTTPPPTTTSNTPTTTTSSTTTTKTNSPTNSPINTNEPNLNKEDNTKTIVGAVVGGIVGLALIGGFLAWLNRRGGCTSKSNHRKERKADFEDFGLAERDFPHHRSPPTTKATAGMASGAGVAAGVVSPTIPRLNDQGNYYNDPNNQHYMQQGYDQYHDGYYYPQDGGAGSGYYDENGYYYDGTTAVHSNSYEPMSPPQQNYHPNMNMMANTAPLPPLPNANHQNEIYKPDSIK
ncbi:hypothetical protein BJ944DRAFT_260131 [Cunninghamella echinulata]|nr:hypothetical protein BJ944DRAFT_260131 [Cunninghamella echinulata]